MVSDETRGDEVTVALNTGRIFGPSVSLRVVEEAEAADRRSAWAILSPHLAREVADALRRAADEIEP